MLACAVSGRIAGAARWRHRTTTEDGLNQVRIAVLCIGVAVAAVVPGVLAQTGASSAPPAAAPAAPGPGSAMPPAHGAPPTTKSAAEAAKKAPPKPVKKVDINNASVAELKSQLQVGDEVAQKIVANRPYKSKGELVTKAGLPEGVYHSIKRKIEMRTPREPGKSDKDKAGTAAKAAKNDGATDKASAAGTTAKTDSAAKK
jgi:DNA uptake protein ComE-like DNA-binding protein